MQRPVHYGSAFGQQLAPVGEELRIVMQARGMSLKPRPQVDAHTIQVLAGNSRLRSLSRYKQRRSQQQDGGAIHSCIAAYHSVTSLQDLASSSPSLQTSRRIA